MSYTFPVLIHPGIGGFNIPKNIKHLYDSNRRQREPSYAGICPCTSVVEDRTDPYLIHLFEKYFLENIDIVIQQIPSKYKGFISIEEYDGSEKIVLLEDKLELHNLRAEAQKMRDCLLKIKTIFDLDPSIVCSDDQKLLAEGLIDVLQTKIDLHKR
jgi:hypothetical protein